MFRIIREIRATVQMANEIAAAGGDGPRWTLFLTNRSFIAQVIATLFAALGFFGVFLPVDANTAIEVIAAVGFLGAQGWALVERIGGKTRAVWNREQAVKAVQEAAALNETGDALADALAKALGTKPYFPVENNGARG